MLQKDTYAKKLSTWVEEEYLNQTSGSETIYLHNSSLTNGANDNSYRYAGANPNNYVCFGSDAESCPDDNLYRIIGVFDNKVKLIKWDYATSDLLGIDGEYADVYNYGGTNIGTNLKTAIGGYIWNSSNYGRWDTSTLNTTNLNTNFLTNIGSTWAEKIATTEWTIGDTAQNRIMDLTAATVYTNERINPNASLTVTNQIGLMYVSDYGYAAEPSAWTTNLSSYSSSTNNWMYMGLIEWTITHIYNTSMSFLISNSGAVDFSSSTQGPFAIRPVFYLNENITINGDHIGSKTDPIRIN